MVDEIVCICLGLNKVKSECINPRYFLNTILGRNKLNRPFRPSNSIAHFEVRQVESAIDHVEEC